MFADSKISRHQNALCIETDGKKIIPPTDVEALYVHGQVNFNSALIHFLGGKQIPVFFFSYYDHYTGAFFPKSGMQSGSLLIQQVKSYLEPERRLLLARKIVYGAGSNCRKMLMYYANRKQPALEPIIATIDIFLQKIQRATSIPELMGYEANVRAGYYKSFDHIVPALPMKGRSRRPPQNEMNALISFGNSLCYTACLQELYHTRLDPTISFLHEPGYRRFSLALDIAEIFKPVLVDRTIFKLVNKKMIGTNHFEWKDGGCYLSQEGRKIFVRAWEERLRDTIQHPSVNRSMSYKEFLRHEGHKLSAHLSGKDIYEPFKAQW